MGTLWVRPRPPTVFSPPSATLALPGMSSPTSAKPPSNGELLSCPAWLMILKAPCRVPARVATCGAIFMSTNSCASSRSISASIRAGVAGARESRASLRSTAAWAAASAAALAPTAACAAAASAAIARLPASASPIRASSLADSAAVSATWAVSAAVRADWSASRVRAASSSGGISRCQGSLPGVAGHRSRVALSGCHIAAHSGPRHHPHRSHRAPNRRPRAEEQTESPMYFDSFGVAPYPFQSVNMR